MLIPFYITEVIMVLAASFEFEKSHNSEIVERPSDNEEVPQVWALVYRGQKFHSSARYYE